MLLDLSRFASLLLAILSLDAVAHVAFFEPGGNPERQWVPALGMLLLSGIACLLSGWMFSISPRTNTGTVHGLLRSLPMLIFWWAGSLLVILFAAAWFLERYYLPLRVSRGCC